MPPIKTPKISSGGSPKMSSSLATLFKKLQVQPESMSEDRLQELRYAAEDLDPAIYKLVEPWIFDSATSSQQPQQKEEQSRSEQPTAATTESLGGTLETEEKVLSTAKSRRTPQPPRNRREIERDALRRYRERFGARPPLHQPVSSYLRSKWEMKEKEKELTRARVRRQAHKSDLDMYSEHIFAKAMDEDEERERMLLMKDLEERKNEVQKLTRKFMDWVLSIEPPVPDTQPCIDEETLTKMFSVGEDSLQIRLRIPVFVHELRPVPTQLSSAVNLEQTPPTLQYLLQDREGISRKIKKNKYGHVAWNIPVRKWFTKWDSEYGYQTKPENMAISFTEIHDLLGNLMDPKELENLTFE